MNRLVGPLLITALAALAVLAAVPAAASATPTPSPSLDQVLSPPPTGYAELTSSPFHGKFTASEYATASDSTKAAQIEDTLKHDGFVDGYGKTWIQQAAAHALVEAVLAFSGGKGARSWLLSAEAGDKSDPAYVRADSMSGIGTYYGGHFSYTSSKTVGDAFSFVKGNDVYIVAAVSAKDDVLDLAMTQTKAQYDAAPNQTIPSSQWPENAVSGSSTSGPGLALGIGIGVLVVLVLAVLGLVMRRRRAVTPALAGAMPASGVPPEAGVQMSPDGNYWWDGQTWRDASHEVPSTAQRSSDGTLWWDGRTWRPVPQGAPRAETPSG